MGKDKLSEQRSKLEEKDMIGKEAVIDPKYRIDTEENREFLRKNAEALLAFGRHFPSPGGGSYYLGDDGTPWTDRPRETWITSRMLHVYSIGAMSGLFDEKAEECPELSPEECRMLASRALKGLCGELHDDLHGGWYAGITSSGEILPGKQCYAHAFVILGASSAVLAGLEGAKELLEEAISTYDRYFWNEEEGLSSDTWNNEFTACDEYRGLNANMHTVEAFLAAADLFEVLGDARSHLYRKRAGRIIDHVIRWAEENDYRIPEHYSSDWKPLLSLNQEKPDDPFKPYGATPGHGIEWARLIGEWALSSGVSREARPGEGGGAIDVSGSVDSAEYLRHACRLYQRAVSDAWDRDGAPGLVYTTDWDGTPVVHDRMHWTLAEAINTSAVLYRVTKEERYAEDLGMFLKYLEEKVIDPSNGSWFHQLDRENRPKGTVWPGKPDIYHAFQAMLIPYADPSRSVSCGIGKNMIRS